MQKNPKKKRDRDKVRQPKLNSKLYIIDLTPKTNILQEENHDIENAVHNCYYLKNQISHIDKIETKRQPRSSKYQKFQTNSDLIIKTNTTLISSKHLQFNKKKLTYCL